MLDRSDWMLLFLGVPGGPFPCDQVRVMKGLFLLNQNPLHPLHNQYRFEAFDYGPLDAAVYSDLDTLQLAGFITVNRSLGSSRKTYGLTEKGQQRFLELKDSVSPQDFNQVEKIKIQVTSQDFDQLLDQIYSEYPEFATNSVARVASRAG